MSAIESEAWVEAAARTMCREAGGDPDALNRSGFMMWTYYQEDALAAIRALFPLIIERCAEVARQQNIGMYDHSGAVAASVAIRALIQKEASDGDHA